MSLVERDSTPKSDVVFRNSILPVLLEPTSARRQCNAGAKPNGLKTRALRHFEFTTVSEAHEISGEIPKLKFEPTGYEPSRPS